MRTYKKGACVTFRSTKESYGALSNMAPGFPVKINDIVVKNVEALYQSLKFPNHPEIQEKILNTNSPIISKDISRKHSDYERKDWFAVRFKVMKFCIELKLSQNVDSFSSVLLATKDLPIVEYTTDDKVWGAVDKGEYYEGVNALGRLLMGLREKFKNDPKNYTIEVPQVVNLNFLNNNLKNMIENNLL